MCLEREMNSFFDVGAERKGKGSTSSNFTQRKQREQGRLHKNEKEGQDSFSLCEVEVEGYKEKKESIKKIGESNQHL